jgi:hypothetical protein
VANACYTRILFVMFTLPRTVFRALWALCFIVSVVAGLTPALAQDTRPSLSIDAADTPLVISGQWSEARINFSRNVRLRLTGTESAELILLASDLRGDNGDIIDRTNISIAAGTRLFAGVPQDVVVEVMNVQAPGNYIGQIMFFLPGQTEAEALTVPLEVRAPASPNVEPIKAAVAYRVVQCNSGLECWLASIFIPDSAAGDTLSLSLNNLTQQNVTIGSASVDMVGEKTGLAIGENALQIRAPQLMLANDVYAVPMAINRAALPPDQYEGTVRFKIDGVTLPIVINATLSVRAGPLLPLLIIIVGVVVGRLTRQMEMPESKKRVELTGLRNAVANDIQEIEVGSVRSYLEGELAPLKEWIERSRQLPDLADIEGKLNTLQNKTLKAKTLDQAQSRIQGVANSQTQQELNALMGQARTFITGNDMDGFNRTIDTINNKVLTMSIATSEGTMGGEGGGEVRRAMRGMESAEAAVLAAGGGGLDDVSRQLDEAKKRPTRVDAPPQRNLITRILSFIVGIPTDSDVQFFIIRPILWLILLVVVALIGLQSLYVNAGATFGTAGVYDYLGLFLWGVTSDVALSGVRTLQQATTGRG